MVEPERTPVLTLDELLRLSGADRPDAAAHEEEDSEDVLRRLFSDAEEPPAAAEEPPSSAPLATAAATLASLFGVEEAARADGGDPLPADCAPSFDLFAAFGAASGDDAPESLSASPQQDSSDGGKDARPFSLSDALGVEAPAAPQRTSRRAARGAVRCAAASPVSASAVLRASAGCGAAPIRAPACRQTAAGRDSFVRQGRVRREAEGRRARGLSDARTCGSGASDPFGTFGVGAGACRVRRKSGSQAAPIGRRKAVGACREGLWQACGRSASCLRGGF